MVRFSELLGIPHGLTALVGSGGKTTLLYRLAQELSEKGRVLVATSTHILPPVHIPVVQVVQQAASGSLCVGMPCENGKLTAPQQPFAELVQRADFVLVEADGSAGRPLKAHAPHEPVIPEIAARVITVVGASGIGRPIAEAVHRPAIFSALAGTTELATAAAVARVLEREALGDFVLINQADAADRADIAALAKSLSRPSAAASLQRGELLCLF